MMTNDGYAARKMVKKVIFAIVILFFLLIQIYPVLWVFMASIKPTVELSSTPFSLPANPTFENYISVIREGNIWRYMWNSIKVTGGSLILIMIFSSTLGFALSKFRCRLNGKLYSFLTFGIMIPVQITLIPLFISDELIEAATIDGCTPYSIFTKIMLPLAKNTFVTIASMYSILIWNDFIFANTFISRNSAKTVAMGLKDYVGAFGNVDWGLTFAAIAISILPPMIVYFALNKQVTAGMTIGATKG